MRAIDTNILARLVLRDDERQYEIAGRVIEEPVWVTPTVWLELGWLLYKKLKLDRTRVADALLALLSIETINTEDHEGVAWSIARFRAGADWADMMHLRSARGIARTFATFDTDVAPGAGEASPFPLETLR